MHIVVMILVVHIPNTLWGSEAKQCFGNETFYRQLSESTTDNIEMRVCRDQGRDVSAVAM